MTPAMIIGIGVLAALLMFGLIGTTIYLTYKRAPKIAKKMYNRFLDEE